MKKSRLLVAIYALPLTLFGSHAAAVSLLTDYMVVTSLSADDGIAFTMSNSEIGAIGPILPDGTTVSPPGSLPALPGGTVRSVTTGISLDGDVAVTNSGKVSVTLSNSDVHAINTGPNNPGSQGIDCDSSFNDCTDNGSQISSNNQFNQSSPTASFSTLLENNGIQGGIDLSGVTSELASMYAFVDLQTSTSTIDLTASSGQISGVANEVWDYSGDGAGLYIVDITTDGNKFYIANSNLTIKGDADDIIIFRIESSWTMEVTQSNLLLDGNIGDNNVLWYVDADEGEESFNFDNVTFQGMSLMDLDPNDAKNIAIFNNVQFCGQVVTDSVNFQNVSGSECAFDMSSTAVPVPAAVWLFGSGLLGLVGVARRKKM